MHGPVFGTVTVGGKPYAITRQRSTYGEDAHSLGRPARHDHRPRPTVKGFFESANQFGFTFNWGYASRDTTAYFSSGKLPRRAPRHEQAAAHARHRQLRLARLHLAATSTRTTWAGPAGSS